jgi:hypothetical protein
VAELSEIQKAINGLLIEIRDNVGMEGWTSHKDPLLRTLGDLVEQANGVYARLPGNDPLSGKWLRYPTFNIKIYLVRCSFYL